MLRYRLSLVALICVLLVLLIGMPLQVHGSSVSEQDAENYTQTVLTTYSQKLEGAFREPYRTYFYFYSHIPFAVNATVSNTHGCAIEFTPANESSFTFATTTLGIEQAVFPITNATGMPMFVVNGNHNTLEGGFIFTDGGNLLQMANQGTLWLFNVTVNGRYYFAMMIKGSNSADSWSSEIAKEDAQDLFEDDLFRAFNNSEEVRMYMAYPLLQQLISQIVWKHQHAQDIGYDLLQYREDLQRVRDLAVNTYRLNSTFVDEILNWLESEYPRRTVVGNSTL